MPKSKRPNLQPLKVSSFTTILAQKHQTLLKGGEDVYSDARHCYVGTYSGIASQIC